MAGPTGARATALAALAAPRKALTPVGGNVSANADTGESPLRGGGGAAARKLRKNSLGSQSEPDLNAARRRRKRGSKKVKKVKNGALGPREEIHRSNSDPTPTFNPPELSVGGRSMSIGERPASAKLLNTDQVSGVMQELAEVKEQIERERAALADQQHRFVSERTKLAGRLTEAVASCPKPTETLSPGVIGEWSEIHSLANQLAVGTTELSMMVETRDATIARLEAVNEKQAKALASKTEEHACAMRCLQKFAINNRLLGQMMQATEAELKTVTAATATAGQRATDLVTSGETTGDTISEGGEASTGNQQSLLEALLSRLEDAELISRKRLEESATIKVNGQSDAAAKEDAAQGQRKKLAEQDEDGMWAWKSPVKMSSTALDDGASISTDDAPKPVLQRVSKLKEDSLQEADLDEISPVERADNESSDECSPTIDDIDLQIESEIEREMEAEMSMSAGGFDQTLGETGGELGLSVLDDFEISMNIGGKVKASSVTPAGESKTQGEGDDDEFSPVGMTEADLQGEGLQLQDQDWSDPAVSIVDNEDDDVDADDDIIRAEAAMSEMATALTTMNLSTASSAGDESVLAEDNETSNDAEQGSDEEDDEEDADERELMMKLIKARAVHIIAAAHEGKFEPRGGLAALTEQRVVEALMVANCHAGRAVALLEGADEEWNEVQDMEIMEAARNDDEMLEGEDDIEEEEEEDEEDPLVAYFSQPQMPAWMMAAMGPAGQRRAMHRPLPPLTDLHDSDMDHFEDEEPAEDVEPHPAPEEPKPDGWFALAHPKEDKPGLWAMRADSEVLPMVLTATPDTSPTSLRAIVRPEVQQREKTMMNVRETFRSHQWGEEMKRMQKASRRRAALDKANAAAANWTAEERNAAAKSRSPLKNSVSTLEGKRQTFGLAIQQQAQNGGEASADQGQGPSEI